MNLGTGEYSKELGFTDATVGVQLVDGRWLVLHAPQVIGSDGAQRATPLSKEQLVGVVDGVTLVPSPDFSWVGTR